MDIQHGDVSGNYLRSQEDLWTAKERLWRWSHYGNGPLPENDAPNPVKAKETAQEKKP